MTSIGAIAKFLGSSRHLRVTADPLHLSARWKPMTELTSLFMNLIHDVNKFDG